MPLLYCHWYKLSEPDAVTLKLALSGAVLYWLFGLEVITGTVQLAPTDMVIEFDVAKAGLAQGKLELITQVTTCPLVSDDVEYVGLLVPTLPPCIFHWYVGFVPPLLGVAVNVTSCPGVIVEDGEALIVTPAIVAEFTVM